MALVATRLLKDVVVKIFLQYKWHRVSGRKRLSRRLRRRRRLMRFMKSKRKVDSARMFGMLLLKKLKSSVVPIICGIARKASVEEGVVATAELVAELVATKNGFIHTIE
jgi:hypothetical protein